MMKKILVVFGLFSAVFAVEAGANSNAAGKGSVAIGVNAGTGANSAIAIGQEANATRPESIAVGFGSRANGRRALAIGTNAHARKVDSVAIGYGARAKGIDGIAIGSNSRAAGRSVAIGTGARTGQKGVDRDREGVAIGYEAIASARYSTAIGSRAVAFGWAATAIGSGGRAYGHASIAVDGSANGDWSTSVGGYYVGNHSTAIGRMSWAGVNSSALGMKAWAGHNSLALGMHAHAGAAPYPWVPIGAPWDVLNIQTVLTNSANTTAVGQGANAFGYDPVALGHLASARANNAIAIGAKANVTGTDSIAIGRGVSADGNKQIRIGDSSFTDVRIGAYDLGELATAGNANPALVRAIVTNQVADGGTIDRAIDTALSIETTARTDADATLRADLGTRADAPSSNGTAFARIKDVQEIIRVANSTELTMINLQRLNEGISALEAIAPNTVADSIAVNATTGEIVLMGNNVREQLAALVTALSRPGGPLIDADGNPVNTTLGEFKELDPGQVSGNQRLTYLFRALYGDPSVTNPGDNDIDSDTPHPDSIVGRMERGFNNLGSDLRKQNEKFSKGIAIAAATDFIAVEKDKRARFGLSHAGYGGEHGLAASFGVRVNEQIQVHFSGATDTGFDEKLMKTGIDFQW